MRVALVHDYLTHFGGAERVLSALMELYPNAPVFTAVHDQERVPLRSGQQRRVRTSWLQHVPGARRSHRYLPLALMPLAVEQFPLADFDVVLSASHSFSKGVIVGPRTMHVSYCFTPTRYAWDDCHRYVREFARHSFWRRMAPAALSYVRLWDYCAAQRVDTFMTLSRFVARRIRKYYGRRALVVPPPVAVDRFQVSPAHEGYYLIVSRLVPYKRIELAIDACEALRRPLKIVGVGPEEAMLRQRAGQWTSFLGFVPDEDLPLVYRGARALLYPQEEDFGIAVLEAASCGKPCLAFGAGGALETVKPGVTGQFFWEQTSEALRAALVIFERYTFDPLLIRRHAEQFSELVFKQRVAALVQQRFAQFTSRRSRAASLV